MSALNICHLLKPFGIENRMHTVKWQRAHGKSTREIRNATAASAANRIGKFSIELKKKEIHRVQSIMRHEPVF